MLAEVITRVRPQWWANSVVGIVLRGGIEADVERDCWWPERLRAAAIADERGLMPLFWL